MRAVQHLVATALLVLTTLSVSLPSSDAEALPLFSFGDRYGANSAGQRVVGDGFTSGADAVVHKSHVRLTPDRQSKRGYIWSTNRVGRDSMVSVLTFRIHGQGRRWFGDGIGLWFTNAADFRNGDNHGFLDKYQGVGIVLDTFHNTEHRGGHKDLTVQINDGTKSLDDLHDETKIGCDAAFRFHAKSANFDPVYSMSRIRVTVVQNQLEIEIDPQAQGRWEACYKGALPFAPDWLQHTTIGMTATTGALADNHDIVSFQSFDYRHDTGVQETDAKMQGLQFSKSYDKLLDSPDCDQSCRISILQTFVSNFEVEMDHWFEDLKESTTNTLSKMNDKQDENKNKIAALRLTKLVDGKIGDKMQDARARVQSEILSGVDEKMVGLSSGWRTPFFVILAILGAIVAYAYRKYQKLVKTHMM